MSAPPAKRQKIMPAPPASLSSSSTAAAPDEVVAENLQLKQRLQLAKEEIARLQERLQLQEEENNQKLQLQEEENTQGLVAMREGVTRYGPSFNGKATDIDIIDSLTRLSPLAIHYNAHLANQFIRDVPEMLWWQKILQPFLNLEDLSILRCTNTFFGSYWESLLKLNVIEVPQGCPTLKKAMALAVVFSKKKEYTQTDPLRIQMDKGVHEILGKTGGRGNQDVTVDVTCSHITFVGKGKDQTTVRGGFKVCNRQNVRFEELTITNDWSRDGVGLRLEWETTVEVSKCAVKRCGRVGMWMEGGATVTATQCEFVENGDPGTLVLHNFEAGVYCFGTNTKARLNDCTMHHNGKDGLFASARAVVDLYGTRTNIRSNGRGIVALCGGKVNIHLPSQHNSSHDNVGENRVQEDGGSIANINADGTFTHVVVEEENDDL